MEALLFILFFVISLFLILIGHSKPSHERNWQFWMAVFFGGLLLVVDGILVLTTGGLTMIQVSGKTITRNFTYNNASQLINVSGNTSYAYAVEQSAYTTYLSYLLIFTGLWFCVKAGLDARNGMKGEVNDVEV